MGFSYVSKGFSSYAKKMINLHDVMIFRLHVLLKNYTSCQRILTTCYIYTLGIQESSSSPRWVYGFIVMNHEYW